MENGPQQLLPESDKSKKGNISSLNQTNKIIQGKNVLPNERKVQSIQREQEELMQPK